LASAKGFWQKSKKAKKRVRNMLMKLTMGCHEQVPAVAANCYFSIMFIPIELARGAAKYLKY